MWPLATRKGCLRWVWGAQYNNALVKSTHFFCFFVSSFFALLFLLFLFFAAPVSVDFLLCCVLLSFLLRWFGRYCVFAGLSIWLRWCLGSINTIVWFSAFCLHFCSSTEFFKGQICMLLFCWGVLCILFAVLFRPVSFFCGSFRAATVVFGIAYAMPWWGVRSLCFFVFFFRFLPPDSAVLVLLLLPPPCHTCKI